MGTSADEGGPDALPGDVLDKEPDPPDWAYDESGVLLGEGQSEGPADDDVGEPTDEPGVEVPEDAESPDDAPVAGATAGLHPDRNKRRLEFSLARAIMMGLVITSTTNHTHKPTSFHFRRPFHTFVFRGRRYELGRAIDVGKTAGTPSSRFAEYFHAVEGMRPNELFYDPIGYYWKWGRKVRGAVGGHGDHVHVAY